MILKSRFKVINAGLDRIVYKNNINEADKTEIQKGWDFARNAIKNCEYELVILDEANIALDLGLIDLEDMLETLKNKPKGRNSTHRAQCTRKSNRDGTSCF